MTQGRRIILYGLTTVAVLGPLGLVLVSAATNNSGLGNIGIVGFLGAAAVVAIAHGWASSPSRGDAKLPPLPADATAVVTPGAGSASVAAATSDRPPDDPDFNDEDYHWDLAQGTWWSKDLRWRWDGKRWEAAGVSAGGVQAGVRQVPLTPAERAVVFGSDRSLTLLTLATTMVFGALTGAGLFYGYVTQNGGADDISVFLGIPFTAIAGVAFIWAAVRQSSDRAMKSSEWWVGAISLSDRMSYAPRSNRRICTLWFGMASAGVEEYIYDQIREQARLFKDDLGRACFIGAVQMAGGSQSMMRIQSPVGTPIFTLAGLADRSETGPDASATPTPNDVPATT